MFARCFSGPWQPRQYLVKTGCTSLAKDGFGGVSSARTGRPRTIGNRQARAETRNHRDIVAYPSAARRGGLGWVGGANGGLRRWEGGEGRGPHQRLCPRGESPSSVL